MVYLDNKKENVRDKNALIFAYGSKNHCGASFL